MGSPRDIRRKPPPLPGKLQRRATEPALHARCDRKCIKQTGQVATVGNSPCSGFSLTSISSTEKWKGGYQTSVESNHVCLGFAFLRFVIGYKSRATFSTSEEYNQTQLYFCRPRFPTFGDCYMNVF